MAEPPGEPPDEPREPPEELPSRPLKEPRDELVEPRDEPVEPRDELRDELVEGPLHSPEELAQRRAEERAARRRVGQQRLIVLIGGVIALIVIIVLLTGSSGPTTPTKTVPLTAAAQKGTGPSYLAAGLSNATVIPKNILIADRNNNRLLVISPQGQVVWSSSEPSPSDAYFSSTGKSIIVTQHVQAVVLRRGVDSGRISYSYGHAGSPGSANNRLRDPQTAHQTANGQVVIADLGNCRVLFVATRVHHPARVLGRHPCVHRPPANFAQPGAVFPTSEGGIVVTERNPAWVDVLNKTYAVTHAIQLPTFTAPSDANEYAPGKLIVTDRTHPGTVEEFPAAPGKAIWTYRPTSGPGELNLPTLARVLPNGDVLVADAGNDRVIVIDPTTNKIVWQYGHTAKPGSTLGYLHTPDSVDLVP